LPEKETKKPIFRFEMAKIVFDADSDQEVLAAIPEVSMAQQQQSDSSSDDDDAPPEETSLMEARHVVDKQRQSARDAIQQYVA